MPPHDIATMEIVIRPVGDGTVWLGTADGRVLAVLSADDDATAKALAERIAGGAGPKDGGGG